MDEKFCIRIAGNTVAPALSAIRKKGYEVEMYFLGETPGEWGDSQWDAVKDGRRFSATSAVELLGLIAMWEVRGDDWRQNDEEFALLDQLYESAKMYNSDGDVIDQ